MSRMGDVIHIIYTYLLLLNVRWAVLDHAVARLRTKCNKKQKLLIHFIFCAITQFDIVDNGIGDLG